MIAQPGGQVLALTAVEEMKRTVGGHVDQDRAVMAALAEGEVVHAQHFNVAGLGLGQGPDQPQQRVPAHGAADRGRRAGSCPAGKGQARWTSRWKTALNTFDMTFDGRLSAARQ